MDGEWVGGFGRTRLSLLSAIERGDQLIEVRCLTRVMVWDQDGRPGLASARRVFGFREAVKRYFACRSGWVRGSRMTTPLLLSRPVTEWRAGESAWKS